MRIPPSNILFCACLIAFCVTSVVRSKEPRVAFSQDAEILFQRSLARYIQANYLESRDGFTELIEEHLTNQRTSAARLMLAKSHYKLRKYNLALVAAIALYENFPYSRYLSEADLLTGDCYFHQGQTYSAAAQFARVLTAKAGIQLKARAADRLGQMAGADKLTDRDIERLRADFGRKIIDEAVAFGQARWPEKLGRPSESDKPLSMFLERFPTGYLEPLVRKRLLSRKHVKKPTKVAEPAGPQVIEEDPSKATYRIGVIAPLETPSGRSLRDGILLARERFPLPHGETIGLIFEDSEGTPIRAVKAAERMIGQYDVLAIIGALRSEETLPLAAHLSPQQIPLIAPTASEDEIASLPFVFQINATPGAQGRRIADYAVRKLGLQTLATVSSRDQYGDRLAKEFTARAEELGSEVIIQEWYEPGATDYRGQFNRIRDAGLALSMPEILATQIDSLIRDGIHIEPPPPIPFDPDTVTQETVETLDGLLVGASTYEDVLLITPQVASSSINAQLLGSDGWNYPEVVQDGGTYVNNAIFVAKYNDRSDLESVQEFVNLYRGRFGRDQDIASALGHDAMLAVREAINAGGTERATLQERLQTLVEVPGATGRISFRPGDRENAWMYLLSIRRGKIQTLNFDDIPDAQGH
ncbi:MAG: ABC transporter substrate-binding protein [Candidatus Latescibacterota bacterium]|nr:ABC transporter substrate-binding protein [Candidatus Latescibacterota bacterium]